MSDKEEVKHDEVKPHRTVIDFRRRRFVQVSKDVIDSDEKLTKPVEIAVYAVLCMYADNVHKDSSPSISTIAKKARSSDRVVRRALNTLRDVGYIDIVNRFDSKGGQLSNIYYLLDTPVFEVA